MIFFCIWHYESIDTAFCHITLALVIAVYLLDRSRWNETEAIVGAGTINASSLQPGQRYVFRVVALNGVTDTIRETRSDPHAVLIEEGTVLLKLTT